jgi:hypothetical protein
MDKKRSLGYIRRRNLLSLAQDKVAQIKIMLRPSSFDKVEKRQREESRLQAQEYSLSVFIFFLSRLSYYEEGCNMMLLTTPKCSKPREIPRVSKGN